MLNKADKFIRIAAVSFVEPELLSVGEAKLREWMRDDPRMKLYEHFIADLFRRQAHVRDAEVEELLGMLRDPFGARAASISNLLVRSSENMSGPDLKRRRRDFGEAELRATGAVHFEQVESRLSSAVVYRLRVLEFAPDRVVVETENVSAVRIAFLPVAAPGETRSVHFLTRLGPGLWGYYSLALAAQDPGLFVRVRDASLINRVAAIYRHFVGIPTDQEPPLAR